ARHIPAGAVDRTGRETRAPDRGRHHACAQPEPRTVPVDDFSTTSGNHRQRRGVIGVNRILVGDAERTLRKLPAGSVDCVVTSPPYFQLRNYQHDGQLGLEGHVDGWVLELRRVLGEIGRVLTPTGTVWLNVGDSYSTAQTQGAPPKSLLLGP